MPSAPLQYVVDASVGLKIFIREPLSDEALTLFAQLAADPPAQLHVPDLFYIECANILWKYVRRFGYSVADAENDLSRLQTLALFSTPTAELMRDALKIASARSVSAYDACYVALARYLRVPLITADEKLAQVFSRKNDSVVKLQDFAP